MSAASAAYLKLADFAARCRQTALQLPSRQDVEEYWSGIGFLLDGRRYAAPLEQVTEILTVPSYTPVPGVMSWMKGIANVRGRLMAVMDLVGFLDKPVPSQDEQRRLLVVDRGDLYTGLTVDEVYGIQYLPVTGFRQQVEQADPAMAPYLQGSFERDGEIWPVFSIEQLAEDPRFLQVARTG